MTLDNLIDDLAAKLAAEDAYIESHDHTETITSLEQRLSRALPPSFRSLVRRYSFLAFAIAPLEIFGNISDGDGEEWASHLFADKILSTALLTNGYIQFARPDTGSYDPVCFDTKRKHKDGECPIVWVDHEGILCRDKIIVYQEVAPSFVQLVQNYLSST